MTDEFHGHTGLGVELFFEGENAECPRKPSADQIHAPRPPGPELRANIVDVSNALGEQLARQPKMKTGKVRENRQRRASAVRPSRKLPRPYAAAKLLRDARRTCLRKLRRRRGGAGLVAFAVFAAISRWRAAAMAKRSRSLRWEGAVPAPCTGAGTAGSKCRAAREAPDAHPVRATALCGTPGCGRRAGWCSAGGQ